MYTFKDGKGTIAGQPMRVPSAGGDILGKPAKHSEAELDPCMREWSGLQPGDFWAPLDAMPGILQGMLEAGRVPIVKMRNFLEYRQFELRDKKGNSRYYVRETTI